MQWALLLSLSLVPFYRWITWGTERWRTLSKMTRLILSPRHWVGSQSLSIWLSCCCCSGGRLGSGVVWPPICWASLLVFPHTTLPEASSGQLPTNSLKTRSLSHVGSCLGWGFLVATLICIISQSPFRGPVNWVVQPRTCPLTPPFPSCHNQHSYTYLLIHFRYLLSLWLPTLSCHLQFFPYPNPCIIYNELFLPNPPQTMAFPVPNAAMAPCYSPKLPVLRVTFAALNGLTSLNFLMTAIHVF